MMPSVPLRLAFAAALLAAPTAAVAADADYAVWGDLRGAGQQLAPFDLGADGGRHPATAWAQTRAIVGSRARLAAALVAELELEALNGWAGGDRETLGLQADKRPFIVPRDGGGDLGRVLPRRANLSLTTSIGQLSAGVQNFGWGTGILANDGAGAQQVAGPQFGDSWLGGSVARLVFATRPWHDSDRPLLRGLAVFAALDAVVRDDNAHWHEGDRAYAALAGARAQDSDTQLGALLVLRHQTDRADARRIDGSLATTTVAVVDLHARSRWALGATRSWVAETELAIVTGTTTRAQGELTFADGAAVRQLGWLGRARWDADDLQVAVHAELGYASGDNDPRDATARTFAMHTDHNVGLVLFDHVLPLLSARSADRLTDQGLLAVPPPSLRFAVQQGAVQNAIYAHPVVRWRPAEPVELRIGYLLAAPAAQVADPYQTALNGGYPLDAAKRSADWGTYGHEFDARAAVRVPLAGGVALRLCAEAGVLLPSEALQAVIGQSPWTARASAALTW